MNSISKYFSGAVRELHNVTWPTRRQAVWSAIIVLVFVFVFSGLVGLLDYGLSELYSLLLGL